MRLRHAHEEKALAAHHLEKEVASNLDSASNLRAAAVSSVQQSAPDKADEILQNASTAYDITVANMAGIELKGLEKRRQTLETSPPTTGDIIDPVLKVAKTTAKANEGNKGFPPRGRGCSGPCSWRGNCGKKPYSRANRK